MTSMRPDETVRLLFEARSASDLVRIMALLDPGVAWAGRAGDPVLLGASAVQMHLQQELAAGVRVEAEAHRIVTDGDRVHVVGRRRVFERGALSDSPATWTFTIRDGLITRIEPMAAQAALERVA